MTTDSLDHKYQFLISSTISNISLPTDCLLSTYVMCDHRHTQLDINKPWRRKFIWIQHEAHCCKLSHGARFRPNQIQGKAQTTPAPPAQQRESNNKVGTRQSPTHHIGVIDVLFVYRVGCLSAMLNESGQTLHCIYNQCNDEVKV